MMEYLWSPWRYKYITTSGSEPGCVFCNVLASGDDRKSNIIFRGSLNFIILNLYPYSSGHLMIVPYKHEPTLQGLDSPTSNEMTELSKRALRALESEYHPEGFNVGFNLGRCAGAGVGEHVHLH